MKITKIILTIFLICAVAFGVAAQKYDPELYREIVEETVREPQLRNYLIELIQHTERLRNFGIPIPADLLPFEKFTAERKSLISETGINDGEVGAEPYIAIHPTNPDWLVATYMAAYGEKPIFYSSDGGITWTQSMFSLNDACAAIVSDDHFGGGDPVFAFDDSGLLHMVSLCSHGTTDNSGIHVFLDLIYAYSNDSGVTWEVPSDTLVKSVDRPWLAVDNSGSPYDGNLYMSVKQLEPPLDGSLIFRKEPSDLSLDTIPVAKIFSDAMNDNSQFGNVKVDNQGVLHFSCYNFDTQQIVYTQSDDGGESFSTYITFPVINELYTNIVHGRDNIAVSLAVDGSNVFIAWSAIANNDIKTSYVYSNDGGLSFSPLIDFEDLVIDENYYHLMPCLAADNGTMTIAWYLVDKTTFLTDYVYMYSTDGGATLSDYTIISNGATDFSSESGFYGDYNTSELSGCDAHFIWCDGRNGSPSVYHQKVDICNIVSVTEVTPITDWFNLKKIFPNPARHKTIIELYVKEKIGAMIELLSTDGKRIKGPFTYNLEIGEQQIELELQDLPSRTYQVKVSLENGYYATRLLIIE